MRKLTFALSGANHAARRSIAMIWMLMLAVNFNMWSQCTPQSNTISGTVFLDTGNDGAFADSESGAAGIMVSIVNQSGVVVGNEMTDNSGTYTFNNVLDGEPYRIEFQLGASYHASVIGEDNKSSIQFVTAPACDINFGVTGESSMCGDNPPLILSCFVQGETSERPDFATIISVEHDFAATSDVTVIATQDETGSVWGVAQDVINQDLFSAAMVKQYAGLKYGPYAIVKTELDAGNASSLFVDVNDLIPQDLPGLSVTDVDDCTYGNQVGRVGLGNLIITPDSRRLYTTLLDQNLVVGVDVENPSAATTQVFAMPRPEGIAPAEEYRIFALELYDDLLYVGGTVTASVSRNRNNSMAVVMTLDPRTGATNEVFRSNYLKGFWQDNNPASLAVNQWFTDISFTDQGEMVISLSDRVGHRFCKESTNRLDQQYPDILLAAYNEVTGMWELESNGQINGRSGSGVGNGEGPGGGEFFGYDHWPTNPSYHNETALGSAFVLPGSGEIIVAVYDPMINSYSGGLHRYSTLNGAKTGAIELYSHAIYPVFGKATGFGDIIARCDAETIEIGNYVWADTDGSGTQDAGENGIGGVTLHLYNAGCELIGTTTTDEEGHYAFNDSNVDSNQDGMFDGVFPNTTYYIQIDPTLYDENTGLYTIGTNEYTICSADAGGSDGNLIDCDAGPIADVCLEGSIIEVNTATTNHSFDIAFSTPAGFDLALRKDIVGNQYAQVGEKLDFRITVFNQGGVSASSVTVTDYLATGYIFDESDNPGWSKQGQKLTTRFSGRLLPGQSVSRILRLEVNNEPQANYVNYAEISQSLDLNGDEAVDEDSTADDVEDNDMGGDPLSVTDDEINDNGETDEDDHDPAVPKIFDLATRVMIDEDKCYYANDVVKFNVTVYNQGNTDASHVKLVQYFSSDLVFNAELSEGWSVDGDLITFVDDEVLAAGETRPYSIFFNVAPQNRTKEIISWTEIAESSPVGSALNFDFDSTPDRFNDNDAGGQIYTASDNEIDQRSNVDEDDHDPVLVKSQYVDLALMKTTDTKRVRAGDHVTFKIEVINQGDAPAKSITVVDYIPEGMALADENWTSNPDGSASRAIELEQELTKGGKIETFITLKVDEGLSPRQMVNYAEILAVNDYTGREIGSVDVDSSPDARNDNDNGGVPETATDDEVDSDRAVDEDDHDPARVVVIESNLIATECLANATNNTDGQYEDTYEVIGGNGDAWYVFDANNYYDQSSPDPADGPLVPLATGPSALLMEEDLGNGLSSYTITVIRQDGEAGHLVLRSGDDDIETFNMPAESYEDILITGDQALCNGGVEVYCITNADPMLMYSWSTDAGTGVTITPTTANGSCVEINWDAAPVDAAYTISVGADDGCIAPAEIPVAIGSSSGSMSCLGNMNLSLDADCQVQIKPDLILTSDILPGQAYSVMLTTQTGEVIPNATLTSAHIGMTVTAKVVDGCNGNSCWSSILVEDKMKPIIECVDTEIACNKVDEFGGPFATDNCGNPVTVNLINQTTNVLSCDTYVAEIVSTYQAVDAYGNKSDVCEMTLLVERVDLEEIEFPQDFLMMNNTALNCDAYDLDMDGVADLDVTGRPTYNNEVVFPDFGQLCNTAITFEDKKRTVNGVIKITRTWTAWEWYCSETESYEHKQYIEIRDITPPEITCPDDITVSAVQGDCAGTVLLPIPEITDDCTADEITYTIKPPFGGLIKEGDSRLVTFAFSGSPYTVEYTATDGAGNTSQCEITVTVQDNIAPVAICDQNTVVGLNSNGIGYAYALNIDDGSYDACGLDKIEIRRMDVGGPFGDQVVFGCDDVGQPVVVELQVTDIAGLTNTCMANVIVQDKHAPVVSGPANQVIECGQPFLPLSQFGDFTASDACDVVITMDSIVDLNSCGTGTITRTFTASDNTGSATATQTITVVNSNPFVEDDITDWPDDITITINSCDAEDATDPENLPAGFDYPVFNDDACDMVGAAKHDEVFVLFNDPNSVCFQILRTWSVIDWCQRDINGVPLEFTSVQVISVINEIDPDPIVITPVLDTITSTECDSAMVTFTAMSGDCVDNTLQSLIQIDLDSDFNTTGTYDLTIGGAGASTTFAQMLPQGNHNIVVTFLNPCNNSTTTSFPIVINNNVPPNILCQQTTIAVQPWDLDQDGEPDTEAACIDVNSLVIPSGTFHECGVDFDLSFSPDMIVDEMCFDCNDLGVNTVTIYAIDANGNVSSCIDTVTVEDNNDTDICMDVKDCVSVVTDTTLSIVQNCAVAITNTDLDVVAILSDCGPLTITHNYGTAPSNTTLVGASFPLGTTTVTWTVSNGLMVESCEYVVTVIDEIDPTIVCATDLSVGTASLVGCSYTHVGTSLDPTANDNCSVQSVSHDYASAPDANTLDGAEFPLGTTTVTFTVTDGSGNTATCEVDITVFDNEDPSLTCASDATFVDTVDGDAGCSHIVSGSGLDPVGLSDECSDVTSVTHNYGSAPSNTTLNGAEFPLGTTIVTFTATDGAGNTATCDVAITVTDNVAPNIICAADVFTPENADGAVDCEFSNIGTGLDPVSVTDNCGAGDVTVTHDYFGTTDNTTLDGAEFPIGESIIIWTATDAAGNTATCDVSVTVIDNVAPECVDQGVITLHIGGDEALEITTDLLTQQYTDACGIASVTFDPPTLDCDPEGMVTVTATVTDVNNNVSECPIQFNVVADVQVSCSLNVDTLFLDNNGMLTIDPEQVVDIVGGGCGLQYTPILSQTMFDCDDAQEDNITLTISVEVDGDVEECGMGTVVIIDNIPPVLTCVGDQEIDDTEDGINDCQHTVIGVGLDPEVTEACSPLTITNDYNNASSLDGAVIPVGDPVTITWTVTDASGNISTCSYSITVVDNVGPACVDQGVIDITLDAGDVLVITDDLLVNPFTDNCGVVSTTYEPATIDCTDGGTLEVTATVSDQAGNSTECPITFNVIVNDDLSCSFNVDTVYLDVDGQYTLDPNVIVDVTGGTCGGMPTITLDKTFASCNDVPSNPFVVTIFADGMICGVDSLIVLDTIPPVVICEDAMISCLDFENNFGGDVDEYLLSVPTNGDIIDNCIAQLEYDTLVDLTALNECDYGTILRTLIVTDPLSGGTDSCTQEITISGPADPITQEEIDGILPDTVIINDCTGGTIGIDLIELEDLEALTDCGQFNLFASDVSAGMGCPDTITRTYTITAICQDMTFTSTQIIILNDDELPIVEMIADTSLTVNPANCLAVLDLGGLVTASDNCTATEDLEITYDFDGSGPINIDEMSTLEFGEYNVTVTATDDCGNVGTEEFLVSVIDTADIIVTCDKIIVFIDTVTLMNTIVPEDGVDIFQNCQMREILLTYTEEVYDDTTRIVDCSNVVDFSVFDVYFYEVTEAGDTIPFDILPQVPGIDNFCKFQVELRDTTNACGNNLLGISGQITTVQGEGIPNYEMTLFGSGSAPVMSSSEGSYAFPMMPVGGNYGIGTYKNDDVMNGVTTLDLIMIQRHILGLAEFDSPYQYIAADINNSESVNGSDLLALRKMILGINTEFPNNLSWRAIDAAHTFADPTDPWTTALPEGYEITNLSTNMYVDFLGVKIGDINGSASANVAGSVAASSRSSMTLLLEQEQSTTVASLDADAEIAGMQFTIETGDETIFAIESEIFDPNQIGFFEVEDGMYNISISNAIPLSVDMGQDLFTIIYACETCDLNQVKGHYGGLRSEVYLDEDLMAVPLMIESRSTADEYDTFVVSQNNPNPWDASTSIEVTVDAAAEVELRIVDMTGRLVYNQLFELNAGDNTIQIDNTIVSGAGVYYYEVRNGAQIAKNKMIKLR